VKRTLISPAPGDQRWIRVEDPSAAAGCRAAAAALVLALVVAVVIWVAAEALGGILASGATDPNSGPLLVLLALAYWPAGTALAKPVGPSGPGVAEGNLV